ncbi:hypothetical protein [Legionella saoudiensis]|uniref:hypothetical protein n=1 Tax=Legionella saoudiensis TaxID=1750561 RepID=UPI000730AE28|nr:hypothetical protein [Legionella saoudiensis]
MKRKQDSLEPSNVPKQKKITLYSAPGFFAATALDTLQTESIYSVIEDTNSYPGEQNYSYHDLNGYVLTSEDVQKYSQTNVTSAHIDYDGCVGIRHHRSKQTNQQLINHLIDISSGSNLLLLFVSSLRQTASVDTLNRVRNKNGSAFHYLFDFAKKIKSSEKCPADLEIKIVPLSLYDLIAKLPVGTTYEEILRCYDGSYNQTQIDSCKLLRQVPNYLSKFPIIYMQLSFIAALFKEAQAYFFDDSLDVLHKLIQPLQNNPDGMFANICYHQQQCIRGELHGHSLVIKPGKMPTNLDPYKIFQVLQTVILGRAIDGTSMGYPWLLPFGNSIVDPIKNLDDIKRILSFFKIITHQKLAKYLVIDDSTVIAFNNPLAPNSLLKIELAPNYNTDSTEANSEEDDEALQALLDLETEERRGLNF